MKKAMRGLFRGRGREGFSEDLKMLVKIYANANYAKNLHAPVREKKGPSVDC